MPTEKVSLTLEQELLSQARDVVGSRGLSAYVNRALRHQLQRDRLTRYLADLEAEFGPVDADLLDEVRKAWPAEASEPQRRSA